MNFQTPGVYREERLPTPLAALSTGVAAFLGFAEPTAEQQRLDAYRLTRASHLAELLTPAPDSYLADAVQGFFANGGQECYIVPLESTPDVATNLQAGLARLASISMVDLVCAPDLMQQAEIATITALQRLILTHCARAGNCFALLDAVYTSGQIEQLRAQRHQLTLAAQAQAAGALYYPWLQTRPDGKFVPPSGHIAGSFARSDHQAGVHKAPANVALHGVLTLEHNLRDQEQDQLNPLGINCLRALPGRGIRVWGARTLSYDPQWRYINVRRLFITIGRWLEHMLAALTFESNDFRLWVRIQREVTTYLHQLFQNGAFSGSNPREAFYVKCDAETNPPAVRAAGQVVTEIGLAPTIPGEFVVVRLTQSSSGVAIG